MDGERGDEGPKGVIGEPAVLQPDANIDDLVGDEGNFHLLLLVRNYIAFWSVTMNRELKSKLTLTSRSGDKVSLLLYLRLLV